MSSELMMLPTTVGLAGGQRSKVPLADSAYFCAQPTQYTDASSTRQSKINQDSAAMPSPSAKRRDKSPSAVSWGPRSQQGKGGKQHLSPIQAEQAQLNPQEPTTISLTAAASQATAPSKTPPPVTTLSPGDTPKIVASPSAAHRSSALAKHQYCDESDDDDFDDSSSRGNGDENHNNDLLSVPFASSSTDAFETLPSFVLRNIPFNVSLVDVVKFLEEKGGVVPVSTVFHFDNQGRFMGVAIAKFHTVQAATNTAMVVGSETLQGRRLRVAMRYRRTSPSPSLPARVSRTQPLPRRSGVRSRGDSSACSSPSSTPTAPRRGRPENSQASEQQRYFSPAQVFGGSPLLPPRQPAGTRSRKALSPSPLIGGSRRREQS